VAVGHPRQLFSTARSTETAGEYEKAVFLYGNALYNYFKPPESCRSKIRELWQQHGPFDFQAMREEISKRDDQDRDGDLSLFDDTVAIIEQVAAGQQEKRSFETA
jgi:hypothetical protein